MVKINLNIEKKDLWLLSAIMVFLIAVGYVVAYGSGSPATMGHDAGEISGVQARVTGTCTAGNSIRVINSDGTVTCEPDTDTDTDTKCNVAGSCSQVCIGSNCKSAWDPVICTWSGKTYSAGTYCHTGSCSGDYYVYRCDSSGVWDTGTGMSCSSTVVCGT